MSYEQIKEKARTIINLCGNEAYCSLTGDRRLEFVPPTLWRLWYGQGTDFPTACELDYYCQLCRSGQLTEDECLRKFDALQEALAYEFGDLL